MGCCKKKPKPPPPKKEPIKYHASPDCVCPTACAGSPKTSKRPSADMERPPAPPYGREDLWELQFCRWWGWNWVRKREEEELEQGYCKPRNGRRAETVISPKHSPHHGPPPPPPPPPQCAPRAPKHIPTQSCPYENMPPLMSQKENLKGFCKCFFKKQPSGELPPPQMQQMYDTPSNSVMLCETYACGMLDRQNDTFEQINVSRSVSKQASSRRESCRDKRNRVKSWVKECPSCSSEEDEDDIEIEVVCHAHGKKADYSSEEGADYLNMRMDHLKTSSPIETSNNCCQTTTTIEIKTKSTNNTTQTQAKYTGCYCPQDGAAVERGPVTSKRLKAKKIIVNCACHCANTNKCANDSKEKRPSKDNNDTKADSNNYKTALHDSAVPTYPLFNTMPNYTPAAIMENKNFSKFGKPSQNYSWFDTIGSNNNHTASDFFSPISGKQYHVAPLDIDIDDIDNINLNNRRQLPDLIDISDNLDCLKRIEMETLGRNDYEQRVMLDALCDVILCQNNDVDTHAHKYNNNNNVSGLNVLKSDHDFGQQYSSFNGVFGSDEGGVGCGFGKLMERMKRARSPQNLEVVGDVKRPRHDGGSGGVGRIFDKIDEIVEKSRVQPSTVNVVAGRRTYRISPDIVAFNDSDKFNFKEKHEGSEESNNNNNKRDGLFSFIDGLGEIESLREMKIGRGCDANARKKELTHNSFVLCDIPKEEVNGCWKSEIEEKGSCSKRIERLVSRPSLIPVRKCTSLQYKSK